MTTILYPTRGGQSSYPNQDWAINFAKENKADLIFMHVSSVQFLGHVGWTSHLEVIEDELDHMSEFLLVMAQERAKKAGWRAEIIGRQGAFRPALKEVILEKQADIVVFGAPTDDLAVTSMDYVNELKTFLLEELEVEVIVLKMGELLDHQKPG